MNKATVNMTNWQLYVYNDKYSLSGTADHHPYMGKNAYVSRTSSLMDYSFKDDVLTYETRNTIYICPLKYMITWPYRNVKVEYREELTHRAEQSDNILDKIISASSKLSIEMTKKAYENSDQWVSGWYNEISKIPANYSDDELLNHIKELQEHGQIEIEEMIQKENNRLIGIASQYEDCIYIEVSNAGEGNLLAYHIGDYTGVVQPSLHSGMFQDSVLYMKYASEEDPCSLDFRYWPMGWSETIETYSWSDNIKLAVIKNETGSILRFNQAAIPIGETAVFTPDGHKEGLISPDCHNGKSCFFSPKGEEE
ncbi:MAG: hypothetical protein PUE95_09595 [Lachnospiraceae bacterium]|nr:hypothetical protein [Lachnospiraceae bacterium]